MGNEAVARLRWRYFNPEVLDRYSRQPDRYEVINGPFDGSVRTRYEYTRRLPAQVQAEEKVALRFDKRQSRSGAQLLVPFLPDFQRIPASHRSYWESFEVRNPDLVPLDEDPAFVLAYKQNYLGQLVHWPSSEESD
jgi:hypothetical protein